MFRRLIHRPTPNPEPLTRAEQDRLVAQMVARLSLRA